MLYLRLADGRGWVFETHDKIGVLCDRIAERGCAKVNIARPSKSIRYSDRSNIDSGYAKVNIPRKSKCNKKSDRNHNCKILCEEEELLFQEAVLP